MGNGQRTMDGCPHAAGRLSSPCEQDEARHEAASPWTRGIDLASAGGAGRTRPGGRRQQTRRAENGARRGTGLWTRRPQRTPVEGTSGRKGSLEIMTKTARRSTRGARGGARLAKVLGPCLLALLALAALGSASASGAESCKKGQVLYGETCETEKEHAAFQAFQFCPFAEKPNACVWAQSSLKERWPSRAIREEYEEAHEGTTPNQESEFTAGKVTVDFKYPITLQGALIERYNEEGEFEKLEWLAPEGAPTIVPVAQPGPSLKKFVDASKLSGKELERFDFYTKVAKENKTFVTIEAAGPASGIIVNLGNLLTETGEAFGFPVKVKLSSPFLGSNCYVGSDESPIDTEFTDGTSGELTGKLGTLNFTSSGILEVLNNTIVSSTFAVPGAHGCGLEGGADEAVDSGTGLPSASGNSSVINGTLHQTGAETAEAALEGRA
jgi:hypothetical protein